MISAPAYPEQYLAAIEEELISLVRNAPLPLSSPLSHDMLTVFEYHLGWTDREGKPAARRKGKRIRPLLCMLSFDAVVGSSPESSDQRWRQVLPAAAAVELVHNFSLIHDDIEDNSAERHGRPTVWQIWGAAQGINAGDAVFALARIALDRIAPVVDAATFADVHLIFDTAALALTQGQFLDLCFEERADVTVDDYLEMVRGKTAALMAASAQIGARIATSEAMMLSALSSYGENLGIAFQIADDILGIWGDPAVTGKPAGDDIMAKKKSLPLLAAMQQDSSGEIAGFFRKSGVAEGDLEKISRLLTDLNAREGAERVAQAYVNRAVAALRDAELSNPAAVHLEQIARQAVGRIK